MATYEFRTNHIPGVVVQDDRPARTTYALSEHRHAVCTWAGVIELCIAANIKPWSRAVPLTFSAYRVGNGAWQDLVEGERLWGCLLRGPSNHAVVFALLKNGWPVVGKPRFNAPPTHRENPPIGGAERAPCPSTGPTTW